MTTTARPAPGRHKPAEGSSESPGRTTEPGALVLHGIPNCDTVKKARAWLEERGRPYAFHDFKKQGVPLPALDAWIDALGWEALVNRKGTTWRQLGEATRAGVTDAASARALMLAQPSVIKRPVVQWPQGGFTVGFTPDQFTATLGSG